MSEPVVVAEIFRSGVVEGHHYGSVVALDATGEVEWSVGMVDQPVFPRSCNKPLQALAMVRAGLDLPPDLLASGAPPTPVSRSTSMPYAESWPVPVSTSRPCSARPITRSTTRPRRH